jgi:hypothetical protein
MSIDARVNELKKISRGEGPKKLASAIGIAGTEAAPRRVLVQIDLFQDSGKLHYAKP